MINVFRQIRNGKEARTFSLVVDSLPIMIPTAVAVFGCISIALLVFGRLHNVLVWPLGLFVVILASLPIIKMYKSSEERVISKERNVINLVVVAGIVLWIAFNIFFTAQHLFTNRDPGVYAVTGVWLVKQDNLDLDSTNIFGQVSGISTSSGGFVQGNSNPNRIHAQGAHLLPVFLGLSGRIAGIRTIFKVNVLLGGIALLAFYGFARTVIKPRWGALATLTLAISLPMLYFSRDTYTEPLTLMFTFAGLALLILAQKIQKNSLWLLAGVVVGASALVRIDAYFTIAGLLAFAMATLAVNKENKRLTATQITLFVAGMTLGSLLGWLDVSRLSQPYYQSEWDNIKKEFILMATVLVSGGIFILLNWHTRTADFIDRITRKWRALGAITIFLGLMLFLACRQFWYTGQTTKNLVTVSGATIQILQRNYNEQTFNWVVWYLGPVIVILGILGVAFALGKSLRKKNNILFAPAIVVASTTLLYLYSPNISPDQIWASRRLLPVILPGIIFFGIVLLEKLYTHKSIQLFDYKINSKIIATTLVTLSVIGPLFVSWLFLFTRESTWYPPIISTCNSVAREDALLWIGSARSQLIEPTKAICGLPTAGYGKIFTNNQRPSKNILAEASRNARMSGHRPIIGLFGEEIKTMGLSAGQLTLASSFSYNQIEKTLRKPPTKYSRIDSSIYIGEITTNGEIVPIP